MSQIVQSPPHLRLRQWADASPHIGWVRDGKRFMLMSANAEVGTIVHVESTLGREWWTWCLSQYGTPVQGTSSTLEEAKAAVKSAWLAWLADAGLIEIE